MIRCVESYLHRFFLILTHKKKYDFDVESQVGPNTEVSHVAQPPRCNTSCISQVHLHTCAAVTMCV